MLGAGSSLMADPYTDPFAEPSAGAEPGVTEVFSSEASPARYEGFGEQRRTVGPARLTGQLEAPDADFVVEPHDEYLVDLAGY